MYIRNYELRVNTLLIIRGGMDDELTAHGFFNGYFNRLAADLAVNDLLLANVVFPVNLSYIDCHAIWTTKFSFVGKGHRLTPWLAK